MNASDREQAGSATPQTAQPGIAQGLRIAVIYATLGRPELARRTIQDLQRQTRAPDIVLVSAVTPGDVVGIEALEPAPELVFGAKGLCAQRNRGLDALAGRADLIVFFDDDFIPATDYLAEVEALFAGRPTLAGATGWVLRDGIKTPGISFEEAMAIIADHAKPRIFRTRPLDGGLYGCNMIIRALCADGMRFDERLPLYGWLEDLEFTYRLHERGELAWSDALRGVHMGTKGGRTSGVKLGYSQIANPVHILSNGGGPRQHLLWQMVRNLGSNLILSLRPEPYVDRVGRLRGNLLALADLLRRRLDPMRILVLS